MSLLSILQTVDKTPDLQNWENPETTEVLYNETELYYMDEDAKQPQEKFDAALPLPIDDAAKQKTVRSDAAANLIRKKVEAAYANEPDAQEEGQDLGRLGPSQRSKHEEFVYQLTSSGRPLHEVQTAWHEYYAGLSETEKHEVWQEFYSTHAQTTHASTFSPSTAPAGPYRGYGPKASAAIHKLDRANRRIRRAGATMRQAKPASHLRSLFFGVTVGAIVVIIFLFSFFNERFIAPFIQPSRNVTGVPLISTNAPVGTSPEIIIPKINVEIPVVYDVNTIDDNTVELALENGVVHYADTALPGQDGNLVIVGHSSNNIFNPGKYKFAFVLLSRLGNGDTFYLQKDGKRYTYEVYKTSIVSPTDVSVLGPQDKPATASLITCDPPGTSTNRLVVVGEQIDPSPDSDIAAPAPRLATQTAIIPSNSPTLWSRFWKWLSG